MTFSGHLRICFSIGVNRVSLIPTSLSNDFEHFTHPIFRKSTELLLTWWARFQLSTGQTRFRFTSGWNRLSQERTRRSSGTSPTSLSTDADEFDTDTRQTSTQKRGKTKSSRFCSKNLLVKQENQQNQHQPKNEAFKKSRSWTEQKFSFSDLKILSLISRANDSERPKPNFGSRFDEKNELWLKTFEILLFAVN